MCYSKEVESMKISFNSNAFSFNINCLVYPNYSLGNSENSCSTYIKTMKLSNIAQI